MADLLEEFGLDFGGKRKPKGTPVQGPDLLEEFSITPSWFGGGGVVESLPAQMAGKANLAVAGTQLAGEEHAAQLRARAAAQGLPPDISFAPGVQVKPPSAAGPLDVEGTQARVDQAVRDLELVTPRNMSLGQEVVSTLVSSAPTTLAGVGIGLATRNPALAYTIGIGGGAAQTFGSTYPEAREKGASPNTALLAATIDAMLEAGGEAIGLGPALKHGTPLLRRVLNTIVAEGGSELGTQVLQDLNAKVLYNPELTLKEGIHNALVATLAGGLGGTVYGGLGHVVAGTTAAAAEPLKPQPQNLLEAKHMFDAGQISQEEFLAFRRSLVTQAIEVEAPLAAEQRDVELKRRLTQVALETEDVYNPTTSEVAELELARKVVASGALSALPDSELGVYAQRLASGQLDSWENYRFRNSNLSRQAWAAQEYLRAVEQQAEGLYPYTPLDTAIVPDKPERLTSRLAARVGTDRFQWSSTKEYGSVSAEQLKPGEVRVYGYADQALAERIGGAMQDLVRRFHPEASIVITDAPSSRILTYENEKYLIELSSDLGERLPEATAHEFGHGLGYYLLRRSPEPVRRAVLRAWGREARRLLDTGTLADVYSQFGPTTQRLVAAADPSVINRPTADFMYQAGYSLNVRSYLLNADEWMAAQAERAAASDYAGMGTAIRKFFTKYAATLKRIFATTSRDFQPNQTWQQWIEYHRLMREEQRLEGERVARVVSRLESQGLELTPDDLQAIDRFLQAQLDTASPALREAVLASAPAVRSRIAEGIKDLGPRESQMLIPELEGIQPTPEQLAENLETAVLPGQKPDEGLRGVDRGPPAPMLPTFGGDKISRVVKTLLGSEAKDAGDLRGDLDKFSWGIKWFHTLQQVGYANPHIQQLQRYIDTVRQWARTRMSWMARSDGRLRQWYDLNRTERGGLAALLYDQTLAQKFADLNDPNVSRLYKLTSRSRDLAQQIRQDFNDFLTAVEESLIARAQVQLAGNPIAMAQEVARVRERFAPLYDRPYFPLTRFGDHVVVLKATRDGKYFDRQYKAGETVFRGHYFTAAQAKLEAARLRREVPGVDVKLDEVAKGERSFQGMPGPLLQALKGDYTLNLSPEQIQALDEHIYRTDPGHGFVKHLLRRKGTAGFSEDAMRTYANYFFHGASHLARMQHSLQLHDAANSLRTTVDQLGGDVRKRRDISNYANAHLSWLMNPETDWANLRGIVAVSYLGFGLQTALINLTQVPMVTYPHLAALYGDGKAIRAIQKSYGDVMKALRATRSMTQAEQQAIEKWANGQPLTTREQATVDKFTGLTPDQLDMLKAGYLEGWLDESQATELAASAEGGWITRFRATSELGYYSRLVGHYAMVPFQVAEKINRRVTALARYNLAREAGVNHADSVKMARESVSRTQFEYAKWNRPELLRGRRGVFMMFMQYQLNMLYFASGGDKGWWRWLAMMLLAVGPMGLPFAENIKDLINWIGSRENVRLNVGYEAKKHAEKLGQLIGVSPDLLLHGLARIGFGTMLFDLSASMGMGRILPGTDLLAPGDPDRKMSRAVEEAGGASTALLMRFIQAATRSDLSTMERIEKAMPFSAMQRAMQATRWALRGAEETRSGADIVKFDTKDPWELAEIAGRAVIGSMPRRVSEARDEMRMRQDFANYYRTRREVLLREFDRESEHGERQDVQEVIAAIRKYNQEVPVPSMRITGQQLNESRKRREMSRRRLESGHAPSRQEEGVYRAVKERVL